MYPTREEFVSFRLSDGEKKNLEILAAIENRSISEAIRESIREALRNRGIEFVDRQAVLTAASANHSVDGEELCDGQGF